MLFRSDADEDEDDGDESSEDEDNSTEEESDYRAPASPSTPRKTKRGGGRSVTDEDLTAMADYVESVGDEFEQLKTRERWEPFHIQVRVLYLHIFWPNCELTCC